MKSGKYDLLGIIFGLAAILIVIFSAVYLIAIRPFYLPASYSREFKISNRGRITQSGEEEFHGSYSEIEIKNISGNISINTWNKDFVKLEYMKTAPTKESLEDLNYITEDNKKRLTIKRETSSFSKHSWGRIEFTIYMPAGISALEAQSVSGQIHCTGMSPETDQMLYTTSGRIVTDNAANLQARSVSGSIGFTSNGNKLNIKTTSGRIEGIIQSIGPKGSIDIGSVSGAVHLSVPESFSSQVTLRSVSGSVNTDLPIQVFSSKRNSLEGKIGGGGVMTNIKTTSGSIHIKINPGG